MTILRLTLAILAACAAALAQQAKCNGGGNSPSLTIELPDHPFGVVLTADGCHVLVSLGPSSGGSAEIAVLNREGGKISLVRTVKFKAGAALGMVLSRDGKLLVVAARESVVFLDVPRMMSGSGDPMLGSFTDGRSPGSVYVNISPDEKLLFVSDETQRSISVIDLERTRSQGYRKAVAIGAIPTGTSPIALVFSPDGKWLYTSAQVAAPDWNWPKACKAPQDFSANPAMVLPEGAIVVVDVARASSDPAHSVTARVPAGCSPVRLAISAEGTRLYATARNQNAVLLFDTAKVLAGAADAKVGMAAVGMSPVPLALFDGGRKMIVGNSNRFEKEGETSDLTLLDTTRMPDSGGSSALGTVASGSFPREMAVSPDGKTLFVTNFNSKSLLVMDLERLPMKGVR